MSWFKKEVKEEKPKENFRVVEKTVDLELKKRFVKISTEKKTCNAVFYSSINHNSLETVSLITGHSWSFQFHGQKIEPTVMIYRYPPTAYDPVHVPCLYGGVSHFTFEEAETGNSITIPSSLIIEINADKESHPWKTETVKYSVLEAI